MLIARTPLLTALKDDSLIGILMGTELQEDEYYGHSDMCA